MNIILIFGDFSGGRVRVLFFGRVDLVAFFNWFIYLDTEVVAGFDCFDVFVVHLQRPNLLGKIGATTLKLNILSLF